MNRIDCLTERQRDVYLLREKGMSGPAIARQLGITQNAVYQHLHYIERSLKQFDAYQDTKERNLEPISIPLKRGEVKLIDGLLMERHMAKVARRSAKHHLKDPAKRTAEDDRRFEESFRRMIENCQGANKI